MLEHQCGVGCAQTPFRSARTVLCGSQLPLPGPVARVVFHTLSDPLFEVLALLPAPCTCVFLIACVAPRTLSTTDDAWAFSCCLACSDTARLRQTALRFRERLGHSTTAHQHLDSENLEFPTEYERSRD